MGYAEATLVEGADARIEVRTRKTPGVNDFDWMLAACKRVPGGHFVNRNRRPNGDKFWAYPLSVDTCLALRKAFGDGLRVGQTLADWYRKAAAQAAAHAELSTLSDAALTRVPEALSTWLHGYQRAGARWIAEGYRNAGLVADMPGVGKTPETLAAMIEAGVEGPVLVLCPKKAVRLTWGLETRRHLPGVPVYLCQGTRAKREAVLDRFMEDVRKDPRALRVVVIVAEMLRVRLGDPCFTVEERMGDDLKMEYAPKNKVPGMCPIMRRTNGSCIKHIQVPPPAEATKATINKWKTPVGFEYPQLFQVNWSWVVLDESHKLLGSLTISKGNLMGKGLRLLSLAPNARRYALSGTPFGKGGRLEGLFGTLHWLWPDEYTSYWRWVGEHFEVEEKQINRFGKTAKSIGNIKGLRSDATPEEETEAWEGLVRSLGPRVLRRTKEETMKDLPPKTYYEVVCELTEKQKNQYQELLQFAEIRTSGGTIMCNGALALMTRAKQIALADLVLGPNGKAQFGEASGRIEALWEGLETRGIMDGTPGTKIVIASRYNEFLDAVSEYLVLDGVPHARLDGRTPQAQSDMTVERWQENRPFPNTPWAKATCTASVRPRVFLVNIKAGGVSINLDSADELHMMDEDPDPGVNQQMEDRIHRASRIHKVRIYYYRTEGTVEYEQAHNVEYRRRVQHAVLDGSRGMEYVRELIADAQKAGDNEGAV